ncbi:MAG: hypothetical protein LC800_21000, partial [Acidobacteria bacterium]|nr:hypothetical protein [Acidobacteriota bacterium]
MLQSARPAPVGPRLTSRAARGKIPEVRHALPTPDRIDATNNMERPNNPVPDFVRNFRRPAALAVALSLAALSAAAAPARAQATKPTPGKRYGRLVVRNALVIDGNGTPASGPFDIVVEGGTIKELVGLDPVAVKSGTARRPAAGEAEIDATGKYVMPGLINL